MTDRSKQGGFTLVELMLAMAFVAFILIFIVTAVVQTMRIYNKGLAVRQINQAGRQLGEDMTRTLRYSSAAEFARGGYRPTEQRMCVNGVSYVWNIEGVAGLEQKNTYSDSGDLIRFIRVSDASGLLCSDPASRPAKAQSRDMLSPQLTVQRLAVRSFEQGRIVTMRTLISTSNENRPNGPAEPTPSGYACPSDANGDFCAFGEFETTVYIRN